jgi:cytidine deaminase
VIPLGKLDVSQRKLVMAARTARRHAYAPYSRFKVGAAVRTHNGNIFPGCNVENLSFGAGICAERGAILCAVAQGLRPGQLQAVAVYTLAVAITPPCGMCLQVLQEFGENPEVLLANGKGTRILHLRDLLPLPFSPFAGVPEIERVRSRRS